MIPAETMGLAVEKDALLRQILDLDRDAACIVDAEGRLIAMNARAERMTGFLESELSGHSLPGTQRAKLEQSGGSERIPRRARMAIRRKDETSVEVDCEIAALGDSGISASLLRMRPVLDDAFERPALENMKTTLSAIFGGMADGLVIIDEQGTILFFSSGAERLFRYRAAEAVGQNVKILMPPPYRDEHDGYLASYRETGIRKIIGIGREVAGRRKDGSDFPMYLSIGEIRLEGVRYFVGVTHDLTKAKHVEKRLSMLSAAIEQSPVAVLIADTEGRVEYVNSCFSRLTGYSEAEIIGKNPKILRSRATTREQYHRLWETIRGGEAWQGEIRDRRKNGEYYWANETIAPLRDAEGAITNYIALQQDVTDQRKDKEALAASEERFRKVAEMVGEWLWEQDAEGRYIYSSEAVRDILGLAPSEILGRNYHSLLDGDPVAGQAAPMHTEIRPFYRIVNCYRHRDGRRVFTESSGAPLFDESGGLVKWRGVDRDITARKEFEDALRVRNRAIEAVHVGIVISDALSPGNPNIYVNPALAHITGYTQEELLEGGMHMLRGPGTDAEAVAKIRRALATGQSCEVTLLNYRKNGEAFWNELLLSPVPDENGRITHYVGVQTDVTEKRRAEESRRDLEIAKQIQLSLLPDRPLRLSAARITGVCLPATHVGGDYYDYFENGGNLEFVIADVSGHSVGAALIMTEVRSMVRAQSGRTAKAHPAVALRELNDLLHEDLTRSELFITMFLCRYEPGSRILEYANAGHNPGLFLGFSETQCRELDADGLVLGARRGVNYEAKRLRLSSGDKLLFYTDGVTEAQNSKGEFFGSERLRQSFEANRMLRPEEIVQAILREVKRFCEPAVAEDDMALLALEID